MRSTAVRAHRPARRALLAATAAVAIICLGLAPAASAESRAGASVTAESGAFGSLAPFFDSIAQMQQRAPASALPVASDFDRTTHSLDDPNSPWVLLNKQRPIQNGPTYIPPDLVDVRASNAWGQPLRAETEAAVLLMFETAQAEAGLSLHVQSAYRSYSSQVSAYNGYVSSRGVAWADMNSARPGYSEHQTGTTVDISSIPARCVLERCFADTPHAIWLDENAWRFGFILRDQRDKTPITGWAFEPWHFRYVGVELSTRMHEERITTLEEFFELPPAPDYPGG